MITTMILLFVVGYLFIALEHKTKIDKSAVALLMAGAIWTVFSLLGNDPEIQHELVDQLGDTCEILVFLIGAMTIVDLIDSYGGFGVITDHITTRNKRKLMWLPIITFFMSAALDNMTTTIIMVMLLRRLIANKKERWIFAGVIVIAANSGGAWSPIGDVTTIMLWMRGNVTAGNLIAALFLPCLVSVIIPTAIASRYVADRPAAPVGAKALATGCPECIGPRLRKFILVVGVLSLLFVPVFKSLTGLPPYMGMMVSLGFMWILTEIIYDRKRSIRNMEESIQPRVAKVLKHIDMPTILFFLGILMAVGALQTGGVLTDMADWLDKSVHEVFTIAGAIGLLSSVVDNVPLVAACMGMYPVADAAAVAASADPAFAQNFVQDGQFWHLLTYCAGVGGSLLIIGSAAGVVAMGLEKISFRWYLKRISLLALAGYAAGIAVIWLEHLIVGL
ncbi:MAG: sodium:proton antiporter NhaD [Alistipes senegalensis]